MLFVETMMNDWRGAANAGLPNGRRSQKVERFSTRIGDKPTCRTLL